MSELQGPRIPGEERSGRRRPLGWIIGGLITLLLLALLIPFACQALRGGPDPQGAGGAGAQEERTGTQGDGGGQGAAAVEDGGETTAGAGNAAGGTTRREAAQAGGQQGGETATKTNRATGNGPKKISGEQAAARSRERLPETGGMSQTAGVLVVGTVLLLMGSTGLSAVVRRRNASTG
jgi:LPXTG-motif cell wall-anchored protein